MYTFPIHTNDIQTNLFDSELDICHIAQFKAKFIFQPFEYEDKLEQTLPCQVDALNTKPSQNPHSQDHLFQPFLDDSANNDHLHSLRPSNVRFGLGSYADSFNSTTKSIKTNKTIIYPDSSPNNSHSPKPQQKKTPPTQLSHKSSLCRPPNLMKKTISFTSAKSQLITQIQPTKMVQSDQKSNRFFKKTTTNKKKYEQQQKQQGLLYDKNKFASFNTLQNNIKSGLKSLNNNLSSIPQNEGSIYHSIGLSSQLVQNLVKCNLANALNSSHLLTYTSPGLNTKNPSLMPQPMNFYQFCMLLYPQTPKSLPCPVHIMDTLFYINSSDTKEIIYVFKDKKRNLLMKMKNKNKSAYELFMKRRAQYEITRAREQKLRRTGWYEEKQRAGGNGKKQGWMNLSKGKWKNAQKSTYPKQVKFRAVESFTYTNSFTSNTKMKGVPQNKQYEASVKCIQDWNNENIFSANDKRYTIAEEDISYSKRQTFTDQKGDMQNQQKPLEVPQGYDQRNSQQSSASGLSYMSYQSEVTEGARSKTTKWSFECTLKNINTQNPHHMSKISKDQPYQPSQKVVNLVPKVGSPQTSPSATPQTQQGSLLVESPRLTPSNSVRQSIHTLQTNYMALLKYLNGHMIRLKHDQLKAIFHNPLYANERFKNNNNTQYIQALPIEDEFRDLQVYSMHFDYELFKDEPLFQHVQGSLYKQNEFLVGGCAFKTSEEELVMCGSISGNGKGRVTAFESRSPQDIRNSELKGRLRKECVEVYLYYQMFEMYTYASMHYNKQILSGVFRFIEYDNQFLLFETENIFARNLPIQGEFIKAKIFADESLDEPDLEELMAKLKLKARQHATSLTSTCTTHQALTTGVVSAADTPSQTMKKINREIIKLTIEDYGCEKQSILQKELSGFFSQQNDKIQQEMSSYFTNKIQAIKNVKDFHLSKNIFKVINNLPISPEQTQVIMSQNITHLKQTSSPTIKAQQITSRNYFSLNNGQDPILDSKGIDFHSILNDEKKLQKFLKQKQRNDSYARKNISNYSVVRWKEEIKKVKERKSYNKFNQGNLGAQFGVDQDQQNSQDKVRGNKLLRPATACSLMKGRRAQESGKFIKLNASDINGIKSAATSLSQKQNISTPQTAKCNQFSTYSSTQPFLNQSLNAKLKLSSNITWNEKEVQRFAKKVIKEKYTQVNKTKFTLNAFKTDKFF